MPQVCRANIDAAGGTILVGNPLLIVDGFPVVVEGNPVQDHGNNSHDRAVMVQGIASFVVGGKPVCTTASKASCGHPPRSSSTLSAG